MVKDEWIYFRLENFVSNKTCDYSLLLIAVVVTADGVAVINLSSAN